MAEQITLALLLLLLLLLSLSSPALSRTISPRSTTPQATATLDVSASLDRAGRAVSSNPRPSDEDLKTATSASSATLSLRLHSRDFISGGAAAAAGDYKTLTLARLARDAARVSAISARASLAVGGVSHADLKPAATDAELSAVATAATDGLRGPIVSGTSQGSGEYFSRVGIGRPSKPLYMVLDTGSDVTWVQCEPCSDCYQQSDPVFDPSSSESYAPLPCGSDQCRSLDVSACRNSTCLYQVSYGDGSYTVGDFATETLTFGDSNPVSGVAIGCGHDNEGLFVGAAGLLGLGGGALSFPSQISAKSFSYCLVDRDSPSSSSLDFGSAVTASGGSGSEPVAAPLLKNRKLDTFYYVGLTGIAVGGELLSIPASAFETDESGSGGVIVDSGTAITRLRTDAYEALRDAFVEGTRDLPRAAGVALFDTCYDLSSRASVEVPTVGFRFPAGRELRLPAKNYLIPVDSAGTFCLAFAATEQALSIIGNVQQQGTRVGFDLGNGVVGFSPNSC